MTKDELPLYVYFKNDEIDPDILQDIIEGMPGEYDDEDTEGADFLNISCEVVRKNFILGWNEVSPLFEDKKINSIHVAIDIDGLTNGIAGYMTEESDEPAGKYVFLASITLLEFYLKEFWEQNYKLSHFKKSIWQHELIHLLDHKTDAEARILQRNPNPGALALFYLLKFRSEGIAELYYSVRHNEEISDMSAARKVLSCEIDRMVNLPWHDNEGNETLQTELQKTFAPYTSGPWMVMHVMSCPENPERSPQLPEMMERLNKGEKLETQEIIPLLRQTLKLDNYTFLKFLTLPGTDGLPFINREELTSLVKATGNIPYSKKILAPVNEKHTEEILMIDFYNNFDLTN